MKRFRQIEQFFVISAAILLLLTAAAKLFSITGSARILDGNDPVFSFLNTRLLLFLVTVVEICVGIMVFLRSTTVQTKLLLIAWLGSLFGLYRLGLWLVGYQQPCKCLGGALEWTGLSDAAVRSISFGMFLYLLVGSSILVLLNICLFRSSGRDQESSVSMPPASARTDFPNGNLL